VRETFLAAQISLNAAGVVEVGVGGVNETVDHLGIRDEEPVEQLDGKKSPWVREGVEVEVGLEI
jgi:hypothetical protein